MKNQLKNTLVSVIIPVYNTQDYLSRCFNSIIDQSYKNLEILIINDGSTDDSLDICQNFFKKDSRIKLFCQNNEGLSSALNVGLANATGEWLLFVDSDDWIDLDAISGLVEMIIKYPQVELIRSYNRQVTEFNQLCLKDEILNEKLNSRDEFLLNGVIGGFISSLFVKRKIVLDNNLKFSRDLQIKMDLVFTFQCVVNCEWLLVYNKVFYNYLVRENSLIRTFSFEKSLNHLKAAELINAYSKKNHQKSVKDSANRSLNSGLNSFYSDISRNSKSNEYNITQHEIRLIIMNFKKNNDLNFHTMNLKTFLLSYLSVLDFRILRIFHKLNMAFKLISSNKKGKTVH